MGGGAAGRSRDRALEPLGGEREIRVAGELAGQDLGAVHHHGGHPGLDRRQHLLAARHHDVAAEHEIGPARRDADRVNVLGPLGDADVACHRAALLGEAGHVQNPDRLAFEMRRHAEDRPDGHDAGAADAGDDDAIGLVDHRQLGIGKGRQRRRPGKAGRAFRLAAVDGDEGGAESLEAGKILVAARLVDGALAPPFGLERLHRHAIRLHAAIPAALADQLIDDDPLVRIRIGVALAAAALLGRAGLIVDQHRDAGNLGEIFLHLHQVVTVMNGEAGRPALVARIFLRLVGDHHDAGGALGRDLARHLRHREPAVIGLAARHGDRVVEQDLVGHAHPGRDRGADRHGAGMVVGPVAEVLVHMRTLGERGFADPVGAFAAHLGEALRRAIHPLHHVVAADARIGARAFGHHGRGIVRAARAEIGNALGDILGLRQHALRFLQAGDAALEVFVGDVVEQPLADADRDLVGIERALDREQPVALLVLLADAGRLVGGAVELLAHLHLDQRALLLHHDDEIETVGEFLEIALADRPRAGDLEEAQAQRVAPDLVDAELVERLPHVQVGLAGGDDADLRATAARGDVFVELVRPHESQHGVALVVVQPRLHAEDAVAQPDIEPALGHLEIVRNDDVHPLQATVHHGRRFDRLVHAFERHPGAGEARHRPAIEAVIDDLLHARRIEDRDHHIDEMIFGLVRGGRRFGGVVVPHEGEHAAMPGAAGEIGVAKHVAGAVDARTLTVPEAEHAVVSAFVAQLCLLRAPQRGGGELLVESGLEQNVGRAQMRLGALELLVEPAQGRAPIAGDIAGRIEAGAGVTRLLHQA